MNEQKILTGKGITVAVLDTGIFPHIDFDNRIVAFRDLVYGGRRLTMIMGRDACLRNPRRKRESIRREVPGYGTGMQIFGSKNSRPQGKRQKAGYPCGD